MRLSYTNFAPFFSGVFICIEIIIFAIMPTKKKTTKKKYVKTAAKTLGHYSHKGTGACKGFCTAEASIIAKQKKKKKK